MSPPFALESLERLGDAFALDAPAVRKRMLVIVNPYATTVSDRLKHLVLYALQGRYEVEAMETMGKDHATILCREAAAEGYDVVVAFGGDGTVNEAANGLMASTTPLTCLPGGATNVFTRILGIPNDIVDATEHVLRLADDFRPRTVDLGLVNGRAFTFAAGLGLDASVVARVDSNPHLKARLRQSYYGYAAVSTFVRRYLVNPPRIDVHHGDEVVPGVTAIVQNADPLTYFHSTPLHVVDGVALDDGALGAVVLRRASPIDVPTVMARVFSKRLALAAHRQVTRLSGVRELRCVSADGRPIALEVDGDYLGDVTEADFAVRPAGLTVVA